MYELNEPAQPAESVEPKRQPVSRWRIFWLNMAISIPVAVAIAVGLTFAFEGIGWNVPAPILGFICGFSVSQIIRVLLTRHFEKKNRTTDV